jgi:hypothetical protein
MMRSESKTPQDYLDSLPEDRRKAVSDMRQAVLDNLPKGYVEGMGYGMLCYSVPHSLYPPGYHCDPKLPLGLMSIASQKNFVALYHMGMYANKELLDWFVSEFPKHTKYKLDMGKSCVRFKKMDDMPLELIGELTSKLTVENWISLYEGAFRR